MWPENREPLFAEHSAVRQVILEAPLQFKKVAELNGQEWLL